MSYLAFLYSCITQLDHSHHSRRPKGRAEVTSFKAQLFLQKKERNLRQQQADGAALTLAQRWMQRLELGLGFAEWPLSGASHPSSPSSSLQQLPDLLPCWVGALNHAQIAAFKSFSSSSLSSWHLVGVNCLIRLLWSRRRCTARAMWVTKPTVYLNKLFNHSVHGHPMVEI